MNLEAGQFEEIKALAKELGVLPPRATDEANVPGVLIYILKTLISLRDKEDTHGQRKSDS